MSNGSHGRAECPCVHEVGRAHQLRHGARWRMAPQRPQERNLPCPHGP